MAIGEIFALDLECDMVTLSSCSSALGEDVSGEGLVGLTRAFMYAGARSVVAALWEVSGRTASSFMPEFYADLTAAGAEDPAHAFAEAKRRHLRTAGDTSSGDASYAHPFFWAAFVMTGDAR